MRNQLAAYMLKAGFAVLPSNLSEFFIFIKREFSFVNVIQVMEIPKGSSFTSESFVSVRDTAKRILEDKGLQDMHILSLLLCEDASLARNACSDDRFSWVIDTTENKLLIEETKVEDYYGLRRVLEDFLQNPGIYGSIEVGEDGFVRVVGTSTQTEDITERIEEEDKDNQTKSASGRIASDRMAGKFIPYMVMVICLVNIIVYLICTFGNRELYTMGGLVPSAVLQNHEWYRIFTSLFLHVDASHILSNLLMFYILGELLERQVGKIGMAFIFLSSGILGNAFSLFWRVRTGSDVSSVGASGAVFGVVGALLWILIMKKGRLEYLTTGKILILIGFILYVGFISSGVDNAAHVSGLISGILLGIPTYFISDIIYKRRRMREEKGHED